MPTTMLATNMATLWPTRVSTDIVAGADEVVG